MPRGNRVLCSDNRPCLHLQAKSLAKSFRSSASQCPIPLCATEPFEQSERFFIISRVMILRPSVVFASSEDFGVGISILIVRDVLVKLWIDPGRRIKSARHVPNPRVTNGCATVRGLTATAAPVIETSIGLNDEPLLNKLGRHLPSNPVQWWHHSAVTQEGQRQMDNAKWHNAFWRESLNIALLTVRLIGRVGSTVSSDQLKRSAAVPRNEDRKVNYRRPQDGHLF